MNSSEYVKEISEGKWEVKLGAGILPIVITTQDRIEMAMAAASTLALPQNVSLSQFVNKAKAVAKVNEFIANA